MSSVYQVYEITMLVLRQNSQLASTWSEACARAAARALDRSHSEHSEHPFTLTRTFKISFAPAPKSKLKKVVPLRLFLFVGMM